MTLLHLCVDTAIPYKLCSLEREFVETLVSSVLLPCLSCTRYFFRLGHRFLSAVGFPSVGRLDYSVRWRKSLMP